MNDRTMTREEKFADLKKILVEGLTKMEKAGADMGHVGSEIAKAGLALCIAVDGPKETVEGLFSVVHQINRMFPGFEGESENTMPDNQLFRRIRRETRQ